MTVFTRSLAFSADTAVPVPNTFLTPGGRRFVPDVTQKILSAVDVLADGPFVLEKRDLTLRFRGSSNQRVLSRADISRILEWK